MQTYTRAGTFNRRIAIEVPVATQDSNGDPVEDWQPLATVWAAAEPDKGREYYARAGIIAESPMLFRMWKLDSVTPLARVLYRGRIYSVDGVHDYRDARVETWIYARAGANQG